MSNVPNIKRELLECVLETTEPNNRGNDKTVCNLRKFAAERGYGERRVGRKVSEINVAHDDGTVLDWGTSPMNVWYYSREDVEEALARVTPGKSVEENESSP